MSKQSFVILSTTEGQIYLTHTATIRSNRSRVFQIRIAISGVANQIKILILYFVSQACRYILVHYDSEQHHFLFLGDKTVSK
jgi:hypothetical protein